MVVDGCATEAGALQCACEELLKARFDAAALAKELSAIRREMAAAKAEQEAAEAAARVNAASLMEETGNDAEAALVKAARRGGGGCESERRVVAAVDYTLYNERHRHLWEACDLIAANDGDADKALLTASAEGKCGALRLLAKALGADVAATGFIGRAALHNTD